MSDIRSINNPTIFSRGVILNESPFIKAPHPKTSIRADVQAIQRILSHGWAAQLKIHGHRAQIHIPADSSQRLLVYNRQGQLHKVQPSAELAADLYRLFAPQFDWTVIDTEWLKASRKIFVFDILKRSGELQHSKCYRERYDLLPRIYRSEYIETLPLIYSAKRCMEQMQKAPDYVEGLVLKSLETKGFHDTSLVRCRFPGRSQHL